VCDTASDLRALLEARDFDAVFAMGAPEAFECPGAVTPLSVQEAIAAICNGAAQGDTRNGYFFGRLQSDFSIATEATARKILQDFVALGGRGGVRGPIVSITTVGCNVSGKELRCDERAAVVFVPGAPATAVEQLAVILKSEGGTAQITGFLHGSTRANPELLAGGDFNLPLAVGGAETSRFEPYPLP
jgi:hypothetical protein